LTQVTVTADGVRVRDGRGRTVRKILPEWANEKAGAYSRFSHSKHPLYA